MVLLPRRVPTHGVSSVARARRASTGGTRSSLATVYLGLGSNVGDRPTNLLRACKGLRELGEVDATSFMYETAPMYFEDQPRFLNAACRLSTKLGPADLLERVKCLEASIGRARGVRWGPRAVDIDILAYDGLVANEGSKGAVDDGRDGAKGNHAHNDGGLRRRHRWLQIPHPLMHERPFVLLPLADIEPDLVHPLLGSTVKDLLRKILSPKDRASGAGGRRVLPMGADRGGTRLWPLEAAGSKTCVMGILNATPDSFSDGGLHSDTSTAIKHALDMVRDGADIVDIGGESTRPGAVDVPEEVEMSRVVPVVEELRRASLANGQGGVTISVDTRRAAVAEAAVAAGAHLVNDVSAGTFDPGMLAVVAKAGVPLVMMHMRGTPQTMTDLTDYGGDVVDQVCSALEDCTRAAESVGVPRWLHILDPGIGFAKTNAQSLELLRSLDTVAARVRSPLLVGPSRKRFIGELTGEVDAPRRDWGTAGACCSAAERGAKFVRVHNVRGVRQALAVSDAIRGAYD